MSHFEIITLTAEDVAAEAKPLLAKSTFKPHRFLAAALKDELDAYWLDELINTASDPHAKVFAAQAGGEMRGLVIYADNPWETEVLGKAMGVFKHIVLDQHFSESREVLAQLLHHAAEWAASNGTEGLLCKTYTDDIGLIHALERQGFLLMDTLLDYVYDARKYPFNEVPRQQPRQGVTVRLAGEGDIQPLMKMAEATFQEHFGRYHADERIPHERATRIYEEWMKASLTGWADWVVLAEVDGQVAGCTVWQRPRRMEQNLAVRVGHYSIGAVHPDYYGKGLFTLLTYEGMKLFDGIADCIEGPTHINNYPVQQGYIKLLWRVRDARHSFHKWLDTSS